MSGTDDRGLLAQLLAAIMPAEAQAEDSQYYWGPDFMGPPDLPDVIHAMANQLGPRQPDAEPTPTRSLAEKLAYAMSLVDQLDAQIQPNPQGYMRGVNTMPESESASVLRGPPAPPPGRYLRGVYNYP